jgi:hypothetical protein
MQETDRLIKKWEESHLRMHLLRWAQDVIEAQLVGKIVRLKSSIGFDAEEPRTKELWFTYERQHSIRDIVEILQKLELRNARISDFLAVLRDPKSNSTDFHNILASIPFPLSTQLVLFRDGSLN